MTICARGWNHGLQARTALDPVYFYLSGLKGISSMRLHRELKVTQKTAWFTLHRIRAAYESQSAFDGEAEIDEAC